MIARTRVAIIGAGVAGIGCARRLLAAEEDDFIVVERASQVGGTWRDNRYPGVACDVDAHLYSFSTLPNPRFSRRFAPGDEILRYLQSAAQSIKEKLHTSTEMCAATWLDDESIWHIETSRGLICAEVLILACGRLTEPNEPQIANDFVGTVMHSARWDDSVDFEAAHVVVVGTGASAVQLIPKIAEQAHNVVVLQRSAPYVLPRRDHDYSREMQIQFESAPERLRMLRAQMFAAAELGQAARVGDHELRARFRNQALAHLASQVDDPMLLAALTPDYEFGCKRPLFSDDYYPTLQLGHVQLVPRAFDGLSKTGAYDVAGDNYRADIVVFATGFDAARQPYAPLVAGRGGQRLADHWASGMRSYASTAVHGFPNMFVLDGPNASLGHNSAVLMMEVQFDYVLGALRHFGRARSFEVSARAEAEYTAEMDLRSADSVWMSGCSNWYRDPLTGRQVLLWPGTATEFAHRFRDFDPRPYCVPEPADV